MGVTWVCKKRLKTWQWFCLSQSYSNLTYLCLSSVKASKRSLYIFLAFSPSTSHIFSQDLSLKKTSVLTLSTLNFSCSYSIWNSPTFEGKYMYKKKQRNKIPKQLISRLLVSFSRQLEVLMTTPQSTNSLVIPGSQYSNFQF